MGLLDGILGQVMGGNQSAEGGLASLLGNPQILGALTGLLSTRDSSIGGSGGLGGLIGAYKAAALDALNNNVIVEREVMNDLTIRFPYTSTAEVMRLVKEFGLTIRQRTFENDCTMLTGYRLRIEKALMEKLSILRSTGHVW